MTDLSIFITVAGLCLSVATFYFGRQSVTKADGKAAGALETDLRYIKESVGRIEGQLNRDVQRLEGRIDVAFIMLLLHTAYSVKHRFIPFLNILSISCVLWTVCGNI